MNESMAQLTVKDLAYSEHYEWLMNDKEGPAPECPEGMHALAAAEWEAGRDLALSEFENDVHWSDRVIDLLVAVAKVGLLFALFKAGQYYDTWWSMTFAFVLGVVCMARLWTPGSDV